MLFIDFRQYEKKRLPKMSDSGKASASISKTNVTVTTMVTKDDDGFPSVAVQVLPVKFILQGVSVLIGEFDIDIGGSSASAIYKMVVCGRLLMCSRCPR